MALGRPWRHRAPHRTKHGRMLRCVPGNPVLAEVPKDGSTSQWLDIQSGGAASDRAAAFAGEILRSFHGTAHGIPGGVASLDDGGREEEGRALRLPEAQVAEGAPKTRCRWTRSTPWDGARVPRRKRAKNRARASAPSGAANWDLAEVGMDQGYWTTWNIDADFEQARARHALP